MNRSSEYSHSLAPASQLRASVPEISHLSRALLLMGFTMFGLAGGSWVSWTLWASSNNLPPQVSVQEDVPAEVARRPKDKSPPPMENDPDQVVQAPGIAITVQEPAFPVSEELHTNMSVEEVLTSYGQPHLTITVMEHGQTLQRFEYVDPDLRTTSILFRQGKVAGASTPRRNEVLNLSDAN